MRMAPSQRAILYAVPLLELLLSWDDLWNWPPTPRARIALGLALAAVLVIELILDRFRITLEDDRLIYRTIGFPMYARRTFERAAIVGARADFPGRVSNLWRTDTLELTLVTPHGLEKATLVIRTLSAADVAALFEWLQAKQSVPLEFVRRRW